MDKKVSIIIPYYNGKEFIKETIASCYNQEYKNIEVIVVDDYSNEDNFAYMQELVKEFPKLIFQRNKANLGAMGTCNAGSKLASGDYFIFLGQDDILPYTYVNNCIRYFRTGIAFVYSIPFIIDEKGVKRTEYIEMDSYKEIHSRIHYFMGRENVISSPGMMIDRKAFERAGGFDDKYKNYGEWSSWIRLMKQGQCCLCLDEHALYRRHSNNISNQFSGIENIDKQIVLHKYWNECRKLAARSFEYNLKEKIQLFIYRKKILITTYIFDQYSLICRKFCIRK